LLLKEVWRTALEIESCRNETCPKENNNGKDLGCWSGRITEIPENYKIKLKAHP
jgi:hypothetical protein